MAEDDHFAYDAFISYSHAGDSRLAEQLQKALKRFAKPWNQRRALEVYRDRTGLAVTPDLWGEISRALDSSRWFVLLASPESAASEWVGREIDRWISRRGTDGLLPVVTSGEWVWDPALGGFDADRASAVHPALRGVFAAEPYYLDLRWADQPERLSLRHSRFRECVSEIAAPIHGRPREDLEDEDTHQQRRVRRVSRAAVATLVALVVATSVTAWIAVTQRNEARHQTAVATAGQLAATSVSLLSTRLDQALVLAADGYTLHPSAVTRLALFRAAAASPQLVRYLEAGATVTAVHGSADAGRVVAGLEDGRVLAWAADGEAATELVRLDGPVTAVSVSDEGSAAAATDGTRIWTDAPDVDLGELDEPAAGTGTVGPVAVSPSGRTVAVHVADRVVAAREGRTWTIPDPADSYGYSHLVVDDDGLVLFDSGYGGWAHAELTGSPHLTSWGRIGFGVHNYAAGISQDGEWVSYTNSAADVPLWRTRTGADIDRPDRFGRSSGRSPQGLAVAEGGTRLAVADAGAIHVSTPGDSAPVTVDDVLTGNSAVNRDVIAFLGEGRWLLSASQSRVAVWDLYQLSRIARAYPLQVPFACTACFAAVAHPSPDGRRMLVLSSDIGAGAPVQILAGAPARDDVPDGEESTRWVTPFWRADSGAALFAAPGGDEVHVVAAEDSAVLTRIPTGLGTSELVGYGMSADASTVTVIGSGGEVRVLDARDGETVRTGPTLPEPNLSTSGPSVALSDDLDVVVVLGKEATTVHRLSTGESRTLPAADFASVAGDRVALTAVSGQIQVWSMDTWTAGLTVTPPTLAGAVLSHDGALMAYQRNDGTVVVVDSVTGDEVATFLLQASVEAYKSSFAFSLDGTRVYSVTDGVRLGEGYAQEWVLDPQELRTSVCAAAGRDLSADELRSLVGVESIGVNACDAR